MIHITNKANLFVLNKIFSPVDCIHWTSAGQVSLLEDEMRRVERVNVSSVTILPRLCFTRIICVLFEMIE